MNTEGVLLEFVQHTDYKNITSRINTFIKKAQDIAVIELRDRRKKLYRLLEREEKMYENEFAEIANNRMETDYNKRYNALNIKKAEKSKVVKRFLEQKRMQRSYHDCYEIRQAMRRKETREVKRDQLTQINENKQKREEERLIALEWAKMHMSVDEQLDERKFREKCFQQKIIDFNQDMLAVQRQELEVKRAEIRKAKQEEIDTLNKELEEIRLEKFDLKTQGTPPHVLEYRKILLDKAAEKRNAEKAEEIESAEMHRKMMAEIKRIEDSEAGVDAARKRAFMKEEQEYMQYMKNVRRNAIERQQRRYDRCDRLRNLDICFKGNIEREIQEKADKAVQYYGELLDQIQEHKLRRLEEEVIYKEDKIIENRFAREEPYATPEAIHADRLATRATYDQQIVELKAFHDAEDAKYKKSLLPAAITEADCKKYSRDYIRRGRDFLPKHRNWKIFNNEHLK